MPPSRSTAPQADSAHLLDAIFRGDPHQADSALAAGADPNVWHAGGELPLSLAVHKLAQMRGIALRLIEILLAHGADPDAVDKRGYSALHYATDRGDEAACALLLDHGADPNRRDRAGRTPLFSAAAAGLAHIVRLLIAKGADATARDKRGEAALHAAAAIGDADGVNVLLAAGANPGLGRNDGDTPLLMAARMRNFNVVVRLAETGVGIDAANDAGETALLLIAQGAAGFARFGPGERRAALALLAAGAALDARDAQGRTPRDILSPLLSSQETLELLRFAAPKKSAP